MKKRVTQTTMEDGSLHLRVSCLDVFCAAVMDESEAANVVPWTRWATQSIETCLKISTPEERIDLDLQAGRILDWCIQDRDRNGDTWFDLGYDVRTDGKLKYVVRRYWFAGRDDGGVIYSIAERSNGSHIIRYPSRGCW